MSVSHRSTTEVNAGPPHLVVAPGANDEVDLRIVDQPGIYQQWVKPMIDHILGTLLLVLALPLLAVITAAVYVSLGRPVILRQERVGLGGRHFHMYKFRTMLPDRRTRTEPIAHEDRRETHKSPDDPRHTPLGRILRRASLDELPQLVNVVRGDMSLVGPRPELADIVTREYEPWQHWRHVVKPGITGLWQVTERNHGEMREFTEIDIEYVNRLSPTTDLWILLMTVPAVAGRCPGE